MLLEGELRDKVARILEMVAKDGLNGPRDLDVALDAIDAALGLGRRARFRGHGVVIDGELQAVAFDEAFDAEEYAKRAITGAQWRQGVQVKTVRVAVFEAPWDLLQ